MAILWTKHLKLRPYSLYLFMSSPYALLYLRRHPQRFPLGLWVVGWKQHCGNLLSLLGLLPILLGHQFRLQLGKKATLGEGAKVVDVDDVPRHSLTCNWHRVQKNGWFLGQTPLQAEHTLSVSKLTLASRHSSQPVSMSVDDVCIDPSVIAACLTP